METVKKALTKSLKFSVLDHAAWLPALRNEISPASLPFPFWIKAVRREGRRERASGLQPKPAALTFSSCSSSLSKSLTTGLAFPRFGLFLPLPLSRAFSSFLLSLIFTLTDLATTKHGRAVRNRRQVLLQGVKRPSGCRAQSQGPQSAWNARRLPVRRHPGSRSAHTQLGQEDTAPCSPEHAPGARAAAWGPFCGRLRVGQGLPKQGKQSCLSCW